tara:strand:- start:18 stop:1403 length:1386 start_codon:yes stop_codon:yes gene_type:complete
MSEKKSKTYSVEGVTFDKVSFSFVGDKLIGVSERTARNNTFKPISPSDPDFNTLINSDQAKRAFNIAKHGANQVAYVGEDNSIDFASNEEITNFYTDKKKAFDNAGFIDNDFEKPKSIAYATGYTGTTGSSESGFGATGYENQSQLYAYPFDIDLEQDHLKITRYEYLRSSINASKPPSLEGINEDGNAAQFSNVSGVREVEGGSVLGALKGSVILPMPKVTDVNAADWGKSELNAQGMAAAGLASKLIGQPGETPDERERRLQAFKELREQRGGEEGGSVRRKTTGAIYNQIVAKTAGTLLGTDLNADTVLARQGGTVLNPNAEMLFQGPALRDFTFKYRMIARSKKEGEMIRNIIRFLKLGMAPKFRSSTYLKSPDVFSLQYRRSLGAPSDTGILDTVNRFSPGGLALTSLNTDYAPNSYWSAYQDSQPVEITMDLNFVELRPIYYNDQVLTPTSSVGY